VTISEKLRGALGVLKYTIEGAISAAALKKYGINLKELKARKKMLNSLYHPDKLQPGASDEERSEATEKTALVNDAYDFVRGYLTESSDFAEGIVEEDPEFTGKAKEFVDRFADGIFSQTLDAWLKAIHQNQVKKVALYKEYRSKLKEENKDVMGEWLMHQMAMLGAETAANIKRAKRSMIIRVLKAINDNDRKMVEVSQSLGLSVLGEVEHFDITPTLANHFAEAIIRRGLSRDELRFVFGTKGRTAANKTQTTLEDMSEIIRIVEIAYWYIYFEAQMLLSRYSAMYAAMREAARAGEDVSDYGAFGEAPEDWEEAADK
jgi:hypothetical protein